MKNYFDKNDDKLKWTEKNRKSLLKTVVFDVNSVREISSSGVEGDYIAMDAPDWVMVIPEINNKFLMVKQWRHGEQKLSVEFPGGVVDKGEEPETAAIRELEEETGFKAGKIIPLGSCNPNPALFRNHIHFFLAKDLSKAGEQKLDDDEFINYMELSKEEVLEGMGTEQFPHALTATALALYFKYNK